MSNEIEATANLDNGVVTAELKLGDATLTLEVPQGSIARDLVPLVESAENAFGQVLDALSNEAERVKGERG